MNRFIDKTQMNSKYWYQKYVSYNCEMETMVFNIYFFLNITFHSKTARLKLYLYVIELRRIS